MKKKGVKKPKVHETNIEFVTDLMNYSNYGAMAQLFVIDALAKWSAYVADKPLAELQEAFGPNSLVNPDAWHGVAKEIKQKIDQRGK